MLKTCVMRGLCHQIVLSRSIGSFRQSRVCVCHFSAEVQNIFSTAGYLLGGSQCCAVEP